jgi:hypothetical protein
LAKFHLEWIPHTRPADQKSERIGYSRQLLVTLEQQSPMDFEYVITGNESWFYSDNRPDAPWAASRDELPERIKRQIDTGKCLISVQGTQKLIASDTKEPESQVAFALIVIRLGSKHLRSQ